MVEQMGIPGISTFSSKFCKNLPIQPQNNTLYHSLSLIP